MEAEDKRYTIVSFGVRGVDLDPELVTRTLGIAPEHQHRRGDRPKGGRGSPYKHGYWAINSTVPPDHEFVAHLEELLTLLEPRVLELRTLRETYTLEFYCSLIDQIGFSLPQELVARIANVGASLDVTIYNPDGDVSQMNQDGDR